MRVRVRVSESARAGREDWERRMGGTSGRDEWEGENGKAGEDEDKGKE